MAKKVYVGVNNIAKNVSKMYVGVNNVAKKVTKGYVGVNGVAKQFYQGDSPHIRINYIQQSSGVGAYIDTGISGTWTNTMRFVIRFSIDEIISTGEQSLIGDKVPSANDGATIYTSVNRAHVNTWCGSGTAYTIAQNITLEQDHTLDVTFTNSIGRSGSFDGTPFSSNTSNLYCSNSVNFAIFSERANTLSAAWRGKVYSCQIYKDGVLVRDFIPVLKNGVAGLYDNVSGSYFFSAGTQNFRYG